MLIDNIRNSVRRWNRVRATRRELSEMTDRDLADIGISRWQIDEVARQSIL